MPGAIDDLEFDITRCYLVAIFKGCCQAAGHRLLAHHGCAASAIAQCAKAGNMVGMGMAI